MIINIAPIFKGLYSKKVILLKRMKFLFFLLIILLGFKAFNTHQDIKIMQKRDIINSSFHRATESHISDFKGVSNSNALDEPLKGDIEENREPIEVEVTNKSNYDVIGKIFIEKINYSGVIFDSATEENLKLGICKIAGNNINEVGNLVLAGHNMRNGTLFSNLKSLDVGDIFQITNSRGMTKNYIIFRKKIISPYDLSLLAQPSDEVKATLFTCTEKNTKRLVLYAIETI